MRRAPGFSHETHASNSVEWYTPPQIFTALGLTFDLDPCSPGAEAVPWVPARTHYTVEDDGLSRPWSGRVWMNPPYGGKIQTRWMRRLAQHGDGVAFVFSRTDATWFHEALRTATAVCLLMGRVHFIRPGDQGEVRATPVGSALFGWGEVCGQAVLNCGLGHSWQPNVRR